MRRSRFGCLELDCGGEVCQVLLKLLVLLKWGFRVNDNSAGSGEQTLRAAAQKAAQDEGYEPNLAAITVGR